MKFLKIFIPIVVVASVIYFLTQSGSSSKKNEGADDVTWIHAKPPEKPTPLLSKIADEAVVEKTVTAPNQYSRACIDYWSKMARTPAKTYLEGLRSQNENLSHNCAEFEVDIPFAGDVYKACALTEDKKFADEKNCLIWFKLYRGALIDKLTIGETDYSRLPEGVLISKFIGRFSSQGAPALPELRKMVDEIKHRRPDNPSTYKLLAALEVLPERLDPVAGANAAEQGLQINPSDQELQSAWFYFKSQDPNFHYDKFVADHPEYPYGQYFRAAQLWESGHKETAVAMLANLQLKNPQDENFQATMQYLQNNDGEGENPFNVHFDISNGDW